MGIRYLIEGGTFKSKQYIDLVPGLYPQTSASSSLDLDSDVTPEDSSADVPMQPVPPPVVDQSGQPADSRTVPNAVNTTPSPSPKEVTPAVEERIGDQQMSSYGPLRRVKGKSHDAALYRPPMMKEDDFVDMMRDIVPQLIDQAIPPASGTEASAPSSSSSAVGQGVKRDLENRDPSPEPKQPREDGYDETLCAQEIKDSWDQGIEALIAAHIQKKIAKELPPSNNVPELQKLVDESKLVEWRTMIEKGAVKVHYGKRAAAIKQNHPDRFIGSRFVITREPIEEGGHIDPLDSKTYKVKSRWCLQGHLHPDLDTKAPTGALQSPTLSQPSRVLLMQLLASYGWDLELGDIKASISSTLCEDSSRGYSNHSP